MESTLERTKRELRAMGRHLDGAEDHGAKHDDEAMAAML